MQKRYIIIISTIIGISSISFASSTLRIGFNECITHYKDDVWRLADCPTQEPLLKLNTGDYIWCQGDGKVRVLHVSRGAKCEDFLSRKLPRRPWQSAEPKADYRDPCYANVDPIWYSDWCL